MRGRNTSFVYVRLPDNLLKLVNGWCACYSSDMRTAVEKGLCQLLGINYEPCSEKDYAELYTNLPEHIKKKYLAKDMPLIKGFTKTIKVVFPMDVLGKLDMYAQEKKWPRSYVVVEVIRDFLGKKAG